MVSWKLGGEPTVAGSKRPVNLSNKKLHIVFQLKGKVSTTGLDTTDITPLPDSNSSLHGIIAEMA